MAAIEEDQDSFIGCVVWKKNRSSSSSKNPKRTNNVIPKQQFPDDSATLQIAESSKCTIQETTSPSDRKDINSSGDSSIIHSSSDNIVTIPPPKREKLSVLTSGMSTTCKPDVISSADPELRPSTVEHQALNHVESQKSVSGFESQPIVPFQAPCALPEPYGKSESPDEDDLPEFDFSTACGFPPQQYQDVPLSGTQCQTVVQKSGPKFPLLPMPAATMILNQNRQQISTSTRIISKSHQNNAISNPIERESQATMFVPEGNNSAHPIVPVSRANDSVQDNKTKIQQNSTWNSANNDDDDMPEWRPDFEQKDLTLFSTTICPSVPPFIHKRRPEQVLFSPPLPAYSPHVRPPLPPFKQVLPHELQPGNLFQCSMNERPEVPPQAQQIAKFMKLDSRPPGVSPNVWGRVQLRLFGALPPMPYSNFQNPRH
ncbi:hypothetical protein QJS04_geneDACA006425 [Acorus gramineus]|uniref:Uncharacterized protein n=1 Tax=Acorus gramineus TaxID=55184 RepID=A0AAV9B098_ACOGR|nr:hypothetical protein QJS04_geneDACA006425 [Acorus gramineus]